MTNLAGGDPQFASDVGRPDPAVAAALTAYADGSGTEHAVLTAMAGSRLLVPVVAVLGDDPDVAAASRAGAGGEKASEMAMPAIVGRDGRRALPAFTCLATLHRWQADARPVPAPAESVWQAAAGESQAVIIDIAGPVPVAVDGARLAALAAGAPVPLFYEDPDVRAAVAAAAASQPPGIRIRLGPSSQNADLTLELAPADAGGPPVPAAASEAIARDVAARLGGRLRRGVAVVVR